MEGRIWRLLTTHHVENAKWFKQRHSDRKQFSWQTVKRREKTNCTQQIKHEMNFGVDFLKFS